MQLLGVGEVGAGRYRVVCKAGRSGLAEVSEQWARLRRRSKPPMILFCVAGPVLVGRCLRQATRLSAFLREP